MDKNGIRCQNFSPPIEDGGSCSIEQDQVDGPTVRTKCGHVFGLDNLIRNVSGALVVCVHLVHYVDSC